jgi:YgiT-type zinc finger domain-containing protein
MICDNCGKNKAKIRRVTRSYGHGKNLLVIENIPMVICSNCGESYFTSETLYEIERIKLHRKNFTVKRTIPVVNFI